MSVGQGGAGPTGSEHGGGWMNNANAAAGVNVPMGGGAGAVPGQEPPVLWGYEQVRRGLKEPPGAEPQPTPGGAVSVKTPVWKTADAAVLDIYTWSDAQLNNLATRLINAGQLSPDYSRAELVEKWASLVKQSQAFTAAGKPRTPWDVISWMGGGDGGPARKPTQITKQIQISSPEAARAILRDVLAARVGRAPSEKEIDDFQAQLNAAQRENPYVTTTRYDETGNVAASTTTGGLAPETFAADYAGKEFGAEAGHYDTVSRLIPVLYQAMMSPL